MNVKIAVIVSLLAVLPLQVLGFDHEYKLWNVLLTTHV